MLEVGAYRVAKYTLLMLQLSAHLGMATAIL